MPAFPLRRSPPQNGNLGDSKGSLFIGIASMILALCSLVLCARFVGRRVTKNVVGADDYLVIIAHVSQNFSILQPDLNQNDIKGSSLYKDLQVLLLGLGAEYFLRLWDSLMGAKLC